MVLNGEGVRLRQVFTAVLVSAADSDSQFGGGEPKKLDAFVTVETAEYFEAVRSETTGEGEWLLLLEAATAEDTEMDALDEPCSSKTDWKLTLLWFFTFMTLKRDEVQLLGLVLGGGLGTLGSGGLDSLAPIGAAVEDRLLLLTPLPPSVRERFSTGGMFIIATEARLMEFIWFCCKYIPCLREDEEETLVVVVVVESLFFGLRIATDWPLGVELVVDDEDVVVCTEFEGCCWYCGCCCC